MTQPLEYCAMAILTGLQRTLPTKTDGVAVPKRWGEGEALQEGTAQHPATQGQKGANIS